MVNFFGIREKSPSIEETPDARNITIGRRMKTRPGMSKLSNFATGSPIYDLSYLKSDDCFHGFEMAITMDGRIERLPIPAPFGRAIRSAPSPFNFPHDIGGDANTIWHCDFNAHRVYQLSTVDFSVIRSAPSPSIQPSGIGGKANVIWHCDRLADRIYELSTVDFSVIRFAPSPSTAPVGIGGDSSRIWHSDGWALRIYELSTVDFSVIRSVTIASIFGTGTGATSVRGIGGDSSRIWQCGFNPNRLRELSIFDFSVIRVSNLSGGAIYGVGGDRNTILACDPVFPLIAELGVG